MSLTLYQHPVSSPARTITLFLQANNVKFESVFVDLHKGAQNEPSYGEINPMRKVPAIVHGDFKLSQSTAILQYLASALPEIDDHWYPSDPKTRARIDEYMAWHMSDGIVPASMFRTIVLPQLGANKSPVDTVELDKRCQAMGKALDQLENYFLEGRDFIGGDKMCIADCLSVTQMMQNVSIGYPVGRGRPRVEAWMDRCKARLGQAAFDAAHEPLMKLSEPLKWDFKLD